MIRVAQSHLIVRFEVKSPGDPPMWSGRVIEKCIPPLKNKAETHPNLVLEFCHHLPWATFQRADIFERVDIVDIGSGPIKGVKSSETLHEQISSVQKPH